MKFNKETLAGAVFVVFRVLLWLPVLAAAAFFGAALGDLLVFFAAEHLSPAAVGILAGLLTLAVVRSKTPLHTPFERMEQFKQKHHLDRLASFQLEFTLLCMVAFFLSISGIAVFSAAFDSLCAEGLIVPVGWIVCTCLCLFVSSFFIFNLFDLVIIWSALSILAVGCALLVSFTSYAVYVPLTAAFGAAALFLGAAAGPAFLKKMEDDCRAVLYVAPAAAGRNCRLSAFPAAGAEWHACPFRSAHQPVPHKHDFSSDRTGVLHPCFFAALPASSAGSLFCGIVPLHPALLRRLLRRRSAPDRSALCTGSSGHRAAVPSAAPEAPRCPASGPASGAGRGSRLSSALRRSLVERVL